MSSLSIDIDRMVREVLAELAARPVGVAEQSIPQRTVAGERPATAVAGGAAGAPPGPQSRGVEDHTNSDRAKSDHSNGELVVAARVVTMDELVGRLGPVRRVVVRREAVVTPAVRDELLRRGIALEYADSADDRPAAIRLVVAAAATDFDPAALVAGLGREGFCVERFNADCLIAAADQLARDLSQPDTLGILLSRHVAAGLCLANRLSGIRAVGGGDALSVAAAATAVGANLLVADPQAGSFFQLKQIVAEFARGGVRPCPEALRERLS